MHQSNITHKTQKQEFASLRSETLGLEQKLIEQQELNDRLRSETIFNKITIVNLYKKYEKLYEDQANEIMRLRTKVIRITSLCERILTYKGFFDNKLNKFNRTVKWVAQTQ